MAYTIKDIAAEAGVSITTVSLVLNQKPCRVSSGTRKRILEIAKKHQYMPNWSARSLVMHQSYALGLIVPDIGNPCYSEISKGVEMYAQKTGYSVIFCCSNESGRKDVDNLKLLIGRQVDAVIIVPSFKDNDTALLNEFSRLSANSQTPIVQFDRKIIGGEFGTIRSDDHMGGYLATKLLLTRGYTGVACLTGLLDVESSRQRYSGYCDAMKEFGFSEFEELVQHGDYSMESGYVGAMLLLERNIDAIFACNDLMAIGASKAMRLHGKHVGVDYGLVGYDNTPICEYLETPLTSVDQNAYEMGRSACQLAVQSVKSKMTGKGIPQQEACFSPVLVIRDTTPYKNSFNSYPDKHNADTIRQVEQG